jgi:thiol-disulfide isomerase/thioredoxin
MVLTTRRAIVAGAAVLAAGTVAAAALLRKPAPVIYTPIADPAPERVELQAIAALVPEDPPRAVPPLDFVDASGRAHSLAEFAGKGVVLNLWATWCVPCVAELPSLAALAAQVAAEGIVVLPLSSDRGGAPVVEKFYHSHGIAGLGLWIDAKGAAVQALAARGVPTTLMIDRQGRERARLEGAADWASAAAVAAIRKLVG